MVSDSFQNWGAKDDGKEASEVKFLKALEVENRRLRSIVAD